MSDAPDFIWAAENDYGDRHWSPSTPERTQPTPYVRRDPAVLAELPEVQALIAAAVERSEKDKRGLRDQIGKLLGVLDAWDKERADGGLTMHTRGYTPDWFVEAAFWTCYGFSPEDPRALIQEAPHDPA